MNKIIISIIASALLFSPSVNAAEKTDTVKASAPKTEKVKKEKSQKKEKAQKKKPKMETYWEKVGDNKYVKKKREVKPKQETKPEVDRPGLFHVLKEKDNWFFEIPDSLIGKDILTTTRFISTPAGCGEFGGEEVNEQTIYFHPISKDKMYIRARLLVNHADTSNAINKAITVSTENPILGQFKIESHKGGKYKINVGGFFNEDNVVTGLSQSTKRALSLSNYMGQYSYVEDIKSFPTNTEVRLYKTWGCSTSSSIPAGRETGQATFRLNVSFVLLPEKPMLPRYYDPRVGYFTVGFNEFTDQQQKVESKTYISRWRLEPKDSADWEAYKRGELVEPKKPIVYYIDPATPKQWRKYLIQGVNDWQAAFEKAGFKNAIYALEWPSDSDSIMSMEDARYSMIRYLASPIENAYGPHVSDPRTGEILESHICWYHNVMSLVHDWYMVQASSIDEAARSPQFDEDLMGQLIRFVSSHEVGHTLGLRHNFGASSTVPVDSLRNKAWVEKYGHTPSIMDYARFNYVAQPEDGITRVGIFPRINDYDEWAIKWGYSLMPDAKNADEDHEALEPLVKAALNGNKRLWWGDGEGEWRDPRRQTEDLGDDAVKASEYGILNLKRELKQLREWTYDKKDIYDRNLAGAYNQIYSQFMRYANHVIGYIGGTYVTFLTNDQDGQKYKPTPRDVQKNSLDFVNRNLLTEPTWLLDANYIDRLSDDPQSITERVANSTPYYLLNRLSYLNDEYKPIEYLDDLTALIMKEMASGQKVSRFRQTLQKSYVNRLLTRLNGSNEKQKSYALRTLKQLKTKLAAAKSTDAETAAHWLYLSDLVERALVIK